MEYNLPENVLRDIITIAEKHNIEKIVLFGSRARKDNNDRSDIDIAISGGDVDSFYWDINEEVWSLLSFDIVELNKCSAELMREIDRDGVLIYEKDR